MQACKDVSADYDTVVGFFDEVNSFFERIGLVEKKLPVNQTYQTILMRVFASFLSICGISTQYIKTKRFSEFITLPMRAFTLLTTRVYRKVDESSG